MKYLLDKKKIIGLFESIKIGKGDLVFIHHPITRDVCICQIEEISNIYCSVIFLNDSDYYGQPKFKIKKTEIIGKK